MFPGKEKMPPPQFFDYFMSPMILKSATELTFLNAWEKLPTRLHRINDHMLATRCLSQNSLHSFTPFWHSPFHVRTLVYIFLSIDHGREYPLLSFCLSLIYSQTSSSLKTFGTKSFPNHETSNKCSTPFRKGHKALSGACSADRAAVKVGLGWKPAKCALPTSYYRRGETQADFLLAFFLSFLHDCFLSDTLCDIAILKFYLPCR